MNFKKFSESARNVIEIEAQAILGLLKQIDKNFVQTCELLLNCQGHIVVIGIGKSGHIGN